VQRHFSWQFFWFRESAKTVLPAVDVVQEKCKDISAGSFFGSEKVQRRCCRQLMWFRKSAKMFLLAVFLVQEKCKDIAAGS